MQGQLSKTEIVDLLISDFYKDFAKNIRDILISRESVPVLISLMIDIVNKNSGLTLISSFKKHREKIEFRSAYILEYVYFYDCNFFNDFYPHFFNLFPKVQNESSKRHFAKIMTDILKNRRYTGSNEQYEAIASACIEWIINDRVRVAVQVWSIETLIMLRSKVPFVTEILEELMNQLSFKPTPGMVVRLRKWRNINTV
ncbi:MAG: hypothetical protein A2X17_00460 [Bacteroidetes bacterium GWF2_41_61]|nr:MAG: hypothetical protein A2X20_05565 [Bacteroidetes bacterium GWE2_40_15]OFY27993.1 MAG: hypothetical protein A2X17_00460 [Bacteroidetes bacterium GWF2_41_61]OFY90605.1 MAG: hypothetical protein A2266_10310 [Bacteroidetes bacterium RIFOXYA12_FULL_40_10]